MHFSLAALTYSTFTTTGDYDSDERAGGRGAPDHLAQCDTGDTARNKSISKALLTGDVLNLGVPCDYPYV